MFCISLESQDPFFNLALEEILLKNSTRDFLILGINDPCVVIGKHQVPHREADTRFIAESGMPVIRRISGGGAVFHDTGNLNFSFIVQSEEGRQVDFRKYTLPVINFLATLGLDVKLEGKSDLRLDGFKISGNAEHVHGKRVLHHGTLLFESSLYKLRNSLRNDYTGYSSRAVASNPTHVMNLKEKVNSMGSVRQLRDDFLEWSLKNLPGAELCTPGAEETILAESLAVSKYRTWEWNYAYGPEYHFRNSFYLNSVYLSCSLFVKDGIIWECKIVGNDGMASICKNLIGIRHMPENILEVLKNNGVPINDEEVFSFF